MELGMFLLLDLGDDLLLDLGDDNDNLEYITEYYMK